MEPLVRKTVTALFCDVTGSTGLGERVDPETMRRVMVRYFDAMRTVLERHGGTVEKFIGDAVMAVFGVPVAREDDALRACRAAFEMRERLAELNPELERRYGTRLQSRIGVNTGEVVAGAGETFVTGDAVNVAARLEHLSSGEDVIISDAVRNDPEVAALLEDELVVRRFESRLRGFDEERFYLWRVEHSETAARTPPASSEA